MSGRARLALCAAAATLLAACALLPLVSPATWFFQAVLVVLAQTGVGALTRRVPLARTLTLACQALVTLLLLTLFCAREYAVAGVVPGPQAFRYFAELLDSGSDQVAQYAIPAPLTPGIRLMLVGGVALIGLAVDTLAVTFRSAAPAGLPLLALYSVAAGLADGGAAWLWFLLASAGYLMLLLAEGRDRLSQWGRVFGGSGGGARAAGGGTVAPVRTGRRIGLLALGVALVVPLGLPALDGGLLDAAGAGSGTGTGGGTISAVNPLVSLRDSLNTEDDRQVMSYRTTTEDTQDMYLRIVALDDFDGTTWRPAQRHIEDVPGTFPNPVGLSPDVRRGEIRTRIAAADSYAQDWLPMPYPASGVDVSGKWRFEPVGRTLVGDHGQTTRGAQYTVRSLIVQPTARQLATAPEPPAELAREFTKVPGALPEVVAEKAREVTRGADNHYQQAVKLQDWFALDGGFTYDTQVEVGTGSGAIARFLRDKRGFCVHFSFAMASMARTLGIPARVAVGFTPGTAQADGSMSVGLRDAHAWPELYFEGVGWTRFEPTPNRGTTPEYTQTRTPAGEESEAPEVTESASASASAEPSADESCSVEQKRLQACPTESALAGTAAGEGGPPWWQILGLAALVLLVLLVPLLPMLWRLRRRAVRLGGHGRGEHESARHVLAVWQEVTDSAWDLGIAPDDSLTPRRAAERIVRLGGLGGGAAEATHRLASAVEAVLYAPRPRPASGVARDARLVVGALRAQAGGGARLRAAVAPPSARRLTWAVSQRWAALRAALRARTPSMPRRAQG
ncbi:transglutaminase TgpA family protein [Streptomyces griseoaurantiacus]|uniref:transglutaminase TgpA family protein n=1 Tax=Streptomyces griseoaurantiacus TaxID=68213 RepID=UPI00345F5130